MIETANLERDVDWAINKCDLSKDVIVETLNYRLQLAIVQRLDKILQKLDEVPTQKDVERVRSAVQLS